MGGKNSELPGKEDESQKIITQTGGEKRGVLEGGLLLSGKPRKVWERTGDREKKRGIKTKFLTERFSS